MLVDSHCHLNMLDLSSFDDNLDNVLQEAQFAGIEHMLCVCVELEDMPVLEQIADKYPNVSISAGIHPNTILDKEPNAETILRAAMHDKCIAIGETGLDYYRDDSAANMQMQQQRLDNHITVAKQLNKPLIIHTRSAAADTMRILKTSGAHEIGGVMHCFAEDWEVAKQALALDFYISFSGIVTFKNAQNLHEVAQKVPLDRMLIETDSPYLAPIPHRGKQNHPALVKHVAEAIAKLRDIEFAEVAAATTDNFYRCFRV